MNKIIILIVLFLFLIQSTIKSQDIFYVHNDSLSIAYMKAIGYIEKNICRMQEIENFKSVVKNKVKIINYKIYNSKDGARYIINAPPLLSFINNKETNKINLDTNLNCLPHKLFFKKLDIKKIKQTNCYLSIIFLLRKGEEYFLYMNVVTYSKKNGYSGWMGELYFSFDKNLTIQNVNYYNGGILD